MSIRQQISFGLKNKEKVSIADEEIYKLLLECIRNEWVEEMQLAADLPISSVEYNFFGRFLTEYVYTCKIC